MDIERNTDIVTENYDENQIQVLEGLEAVRKRRGRGSSACRSPVS